MPSRTLSGSADLLRNTAAQFAGKSRRQMTVGRLDMAG